jgi:Mrp family chromosome partitioning ATPase
MSTEPQVTPTASLEKIKHILLILSGKGGVGKSSITTQIALMLAIKGYKVGVLDIDLTGPSVPRMFGVEGKQVYQGRNGWIPVQVYPKPGTTVVPSVDEKQGSLSVMSLGFLLNDRGNSVVWRGPKKTAMVKQFINDVCWGANGDGVLDFLLIDTPPGTSDEHIAIAEELQYQNPDGAVIVTTPQDVAIEDVKKEIDFCRKVKFDILGIVENMSGFICPFCAECTNIFSSGGGKILSEKEGFDYLGNVPIDPTFVEMIENQLEGDGLVEDYKKSALNPIFDSIVDKILVNIQDK